MIRFDLFKNLKVIWLNNNKLESISGLEPCIILEELYLGHNRLKELEGDVLSKLKFLKIFSLNNNFLSDLNQTIKVLKGCKYL